MKEIRLTKGKSTLVDDNDYENLSGWSWFLHSGGYAVRGNYNYKTKTNVVVMMQNQIMEPCGNLWVDHINGDKLDNRRVNLRFCSHSQNAVNKIVSKDNTSGYKGVSYRGNEKRIKRWRAYIKQNRKQIFIGNYLTAEEAAKAYDKKAKEIYGQFAKPNFS